MVEGQAIIQGQRDGRLLCSSLTELVHWVDLVQLASFVREEWYNGTHTWCQLYDASYAHLGFSMVWFACCLL